jgi:spermidine synthase
MALEIIGARLLTPYYGDTVYVWGSVIGIFLLSLSIGYFLGGKLADRKPEYSTLSIVLAATGVFAVLVPFLSVPVTSASNVLPRIFAPLFSVTVLFFIPSLLLGMVSPFAIKLKARTLRRIGNVSGNLYAISTMGSVIGTFLATFVLILFLPIKTILLCIGAVSFLVAAMLAKKTSALVLAVIAILILIFAANIGSAVIAQSHEDGNVSENNSTWIVPAFLRSPVVVESLYGQISVEDTDRETRTLSLNGGLMSEMRIKNEMAVMPGWMYVNCMEIPFAMNRNISDVLALGLGAGHFQRKLYEEYNVSVDNVDINDKMVEVAEKYFNLTLTSRFRSYIDDARVFLQRTDKKYDYIAVDVVHFDPAQGYKLPFHLSTKEFFQLAKDHLNQHGVIAMNFVSNLNSAFFNSEYKTISTVFPSVYAFDCPSTVVIIASTDSKRSMTDLKASAPFDPALLNQYSDIVLRSDAITLTDDYFPLNPFEELGNKSV